MKKILKMKLIFISALLAVMMIATTGFALEETGKDGRFIAYNNGTVLDTQTGLMWAAKDNGYNITSQAAEDYCRYYRGGGYSDWRLPTQNELTTLYDKTKLFKSDCGFDAHFATNLIHLTCSDVWTVEKTGFKGSYFSFVIGKIFWYDLSGINLFRALPVRSLNNTAGRQLIFY